MQNNFNDTVNQLKDFNINPSEQVWKEIENGLEGKKKRRIVAWWWSMPAIFLLGIAFWIYNGNISGKPKMKISNSTSMLSNKTYVKSNSTSMQSNKTYVKSNSASMQSNKTYVKSNSTSMLSNKTYVKSNSTSMLSNKTYVKSYSTSMLSNKTGEKSNAASLQAELIPEMVKNAAPLNKNADTIKHIDSNSSKNNETVVAKTVKKNKKAIWSVAVGGGASYISRNNILGNAKEGLFYSSGVSSSTATPNPTPTNLSLPTTGYHFSVGVNVEKQLNGKISLQSGLMYRYLENKIAFNNNSPVNFLSTADNQEYKNSLHLLELPVGMKWCFNPTAKNKVSLLAGLNMAVAIKRNWLFVNDDVHQYQEKPDEINAFSFGLQAGASINFNNKFSLSLIAQKNLTPAQKSASRYYLQQISFQVNIPFKSLKK